MSKLVVKDICKKYGKNEVVKNINLEFETGHIYGLFGKNGSGKSTILNMITQRVTPTSGEITIDDQPIKNNDNLMARDIYQKYGGVFSISYTYPQHNAHFKKILVLVCG